MRQAKMSFMGLYMYDPTIFDGLSVPEGVDKQMLIDEICEDLSDFSVIYPSAPFMKMSIEMWSRHRVMIWTKLYRTTQLEYDPIENYNRIEEGHDSQHKENTAQSTADSFVRGFNETGLQQNAQAVSDGSGVEETCFDKNNRVHGNVGVTTTQEMIEAERRVVKFDIYDYIVQDFKERYCVPVYE